MLAAFGVYESDVAEFETIELLLRKVHVVPPFVESRKVILPVGFMPVIPETVAEAVTDWVRIIGLGGVSVGVVIVGFVLLTVKVAGALCELRKSASPPYMAMNL